MPWPSSADINKNQVAVSSSIAGGIRLPEQSLSGSAWQALTTRLMTTCSMRWAFPDKGRQAQDRKPG